MTPIRWRTVDDEASDAVGAPWQPSLFGDDLAGRDGDQVLERRPGEGQFAGMEFLHVRARSVINSVPAASRLPFRFTINAYRGCSHACSYCLDGSTAILLATGRTKPLVDIKPGDVVVGTERHGSYRRYVPSVVLDHWSTTKPAWRVALEDGTELMASGDHRFLTDRGWKHVTGSEHGAGRRPHLTPNNRLIGIGSLADPPVHDAEYRRGYLCGMVRGDAHAGTYAYPRPGRAGVVHRFRLALIDIEPLLRTRAFLEACCVATTPFVVEAAVSGGSRMHAIRTSTRSGVQAIRDAISWPREPTSSWCKGFLAGIFDAEGSHAGVVRIANANRDILEWTLRCLRRFGFDAVLDATQGQSCCYVRLRGGVRERLRFFLLVDPATTRKRTIVGAAVKNKNDGLRIASITPLGVDLPLFDITTSTADFVANGVVSHNCFARPTHEYLGLNSGDDFERRIVVKVNAVERLRAELRAPRWQGDAIAMGTNTDPYQRCEGKYRLTRGVIEELGEAANPFSILTKSTLIVRDLDVLVDAARRTDVRTSLSIGTLDEDVWRATEPGTPHPRRRMDAVRRLNDAGIPCGVLIAPVLPHLSDRPEQVEEVVRAATDAGAVSISGMLLHLRPGVREPFFDRFQATHPELMATYEEMYPRSYAPRARQAELDATLQRLIRSP